MKQLAKIAAIAGLAWLASLLVTSGFETPEQPAVEARFVTTARIPFPAPTPATTLDSIQPATPALTPAKAVLPGDKPNDPPGDSPLSSALKSLVESVGSRAAPQPEQPERRRGLATSRVRHGNLETAKAESRRTGKPILLIFEGPGCAFCKVVEDKVLATDEVRDEIAARYILAIVNTKQYPRVADAYHVRGIPTAFVVDADGRAYYRFIPTSNVQEFLNQIRPQRRAES